MRLGIVGGPVYGAFLMEGWARREAAWAARATRRRPVSAWRPLRHRSRDGTVAPAVARVRSLVRAQLRAPTPAGPRVSANGKAAVRASLTAALTTGTRSRPTFIKGAAPPSLPGGYRAGDAVSALRHLYLIEDRRYFVDAGDTGAVVGVGQPIADGRERISVRWDKPGQGGGVMQFTVQPDWVAAGGAAMP